LREAGSGPVALGAWISPLDGCNKLGGGGCRVEAAILPWPLVYQLRAWHGTLVVCGVCGLLSPLPPSDQIKPATQISAGRPPLTPNKPVGRTP